MALTSTETHPFPDHCAAKIIRITKSNLAATVYEPTRSFVWAIFIRCQKFLLAFPTIYVYILISRSGRNKVNSVENLKIKSLYILVYIPSAIKGQLEKKNKYTSPPLCGQQHGQTHFEVQTLLSVDFVFFFSLPLG